MYAEYVKEKHGKLDPRTRFVLEVYIPTISVTALLGVTAYITYDAIDVLTHSVDDADEVNVYFLWAFSSGNYVVDIISSYMFYLRGKDILVAHCHTDDHIDDHAPLRTFSLDRRSVDMGKRPILPFPLPPTAESSDSMDPNDQIGAPLIPEENVQGTVTKKPRKKMNLNMLSALTHVGGDTLRTTSVFIAAFVSTVFGVEGSTTDAWASIIVSISIVLCVIPLCNEIYHAATHMPIPTPNNETH